MNKKKIEKSLEWHKKKVAELEEALVKAQYKRWFPKQDEKFYGIGIKSVIEYHNFNEECTKVMYAMNNVFKTKEEAEKEFARRKAETELLYMCDWNGEEIVYLIEYNDQRDVFDWNFFDYIYSPYRFASKESAQQAITKLGKEKLKLIFRI